MSYLQFETLPKSLTKEADVGKGQINLQHLSPALFLETQLIKLHTHRGKESVKLAAEATPDMVKAYRPTEREEHGVATWTGGAAASGSVTVTFGTAFTEVPDVFAIAQDGNANIIVGTGVPSKTAVTIYWKDDTAATHTSLPIAWLAKGR